MLLGRFLQHIPVACLLGIYLLLGLNMARNTQFVERIFLLLKHPKNHAAEASYTKQVCEFAMSSFYMVCAYTFDYLCNLQFAFKIHN